MGFALACLLGYVIGLFALFIGGHYLVCFIGNTFIRVRNYVRT